MATMTRWNPFQDVLSLREAMNQLVEESFIRPTAAPRNGHSYIPAVDLSETPDGYVVEAALPGLKPDDLEVSVENNVLTIRGEIHKETENKQRTYHRLERYSGAFQRTIGLPTTVKADAIQASLENGVLRLEIPKAEEVKPRKISVNSGQQKAIEVGKNTSSQG